MNERGTNPQLPTVKGLVAAMYHIGMATPRNKPELDLSPVGLAQPEVWRHGAYMLPAEPEQAPEEGLIILPDHIDPAGERHLILPEGV